MKRAPSSTGREKGDPTHEKTPIPVGLLVLIGALVLGCALYLGVNSGGFRSDVYGPPTIAVTPSTQSLGKRVYVQNCLVCHQSGGQGVPRMYPPLAQSDWVLGDSWAGDNHLVKIVLKGLSGPIEVNGHRFVGAMVPWEKVLDDEKIAAVLTYIRSEWGNQAPPISPEFVAEIRRQTQDRRGEWTQAELKTIPKTTRHTEPNRKDLP